MNPKRPATATINDAIELLRAVGDKKASLEMLEDLQTAIHAGSEAEQRIAQAERKEAEATSAIAESVAAREELASERGKLDVERASLQNQMRATNAREHDLERRETELRAAQEQFGEDRRVLDMTVAGKLVEAEEKLAAAYAIRKAAEDLKSRVTAAALG